MINRILFFSIAFFCLVMNARSQDMELESDSTALRLVDLSGIERAIFSISGPKTSLIMSDTEGNEIARLGSSAAFLTNPSGFLDGEFGVLVLSDDNKNPSIIAIGASEVDGNPAVLSLRSDSAFLYLGTPSQAGKLQIFVKEEESSIIFSDPSNVPIVQVGTSENGKYGSIMLEDPESSTSIFSGFDEVNGIRHPVIAIDGESAFLELASEPYDGKMQIYTKKDRSGLAILDPLSQFPVVELKTDEDGKYGILNLRNASESGGVSMIGGDAGDKSTSITLVEDTSFIQMFSVNTEGQMEFGIRKDKSYLNMTNGTIDIQDAESAVSYIKLNKDEFGGRLTLDNLENKTLLKLSTGVNGEYGGFDLLGENGSQNIVASSLASSNNHGFLSIFDDIGHAKVDALASSLGHGIIQLWGANGNANIRLTSLDGAPNRPLLSIHNTVGLERAGGYISADEKGVLFAEDYSLLTSSGPVSTMFINSSGQRVISGDVKNFTMDHPRKEGKEIWFACIEGPEVAAYARGTASLINGAAIVHLPSYFSEIVEEEGITLTITPLSADSKGIAVVAKSVNQFSVKELFKGDGDYQFDWEIKAVRSGFENYKVVRDKVKSHKTENIGAREIIPSTTNSAYSQKH